MQDPASNQLAIADECRQRTQKMQRTAQRAHRTTMVRMAMIRLLAGPAGLAGTVHRGPDNRCCARRRGAARGGLADRGEYGLQLGGERRREVPLFRYAIDAGRPSRPPEAISMPPPSSLACSPGLRGSAVRRSMFCETLITIALSCGRRAWPPPRNRADRLPADARNTA